VTMQVFIRDHFTMIAAPVQRDVDGIPKGAHYVRIPPMEYLATMPFTPPTGSWFARAYA